MRFVHSREIVHRDLRLENIYLDEEGHPKIGLWPGSDHPQATEAFQRLWIRDRGFRRPDGQTGAGDDNGSAAV
jgi:serine/threonine protein kinase